MSTKKSSPLPVMVIAKGDSRKKGAGTGKAKKAAEAAKNIHITVRRVGLPISSGIRVDPIAIAIEIRTLD
jgi:hypothetical protein